MAKSVFLVPFAAFIFFAGCSTVEPLIQISTKSVITSGTSYAEPPLPGPYPASVVSVVDGDTVKVIVKIWLGLSQEVAVRLEGIDTPETRSAKCPHERELGLKAKSFVEKLLPAGSTISLGRVSDDKYHGRVVATLRTNNGEDVGQRLLKDGLARPYHNGEKKSWCNPET